MWFLPFVLKASPIVFGFLWAYLSECTCCTTLHSKIKLFVLSLPIPFSTLPKWIRIGGSLSIYTYGIHQVTLAPCLPLLGEMSSQQGIFPKRSLDINSKINLSFFITTKPHLLNPLTGGSPILYRLGISKLCSSPCVNSAILCVCLLLLPCHFCHSSLVSFYCVHAYLQGVKSMGSWACIASLYSFCGPRHCLGRSLCLSNPLGFQFYCSFSYHA